MSFPSVVLVVTIGLVVVANESLLIEVLLVLLVKLAVELGMVAAGDVNVTVKVFVGPELELLILVDSLPSCTVVLRVAVDVIEVELETGTVVEVELETGAVLCVACSVSRLLSQMATMRLAGKAPTSRGGST